MRNPRGGFTELRAVRPHDCGVTSAGRSANRPNGVGGSMADRPASSEGTLDVLWERSLQHERRIGRLEGVVIGIAGSLVMAFVAIVSKGIGIV